MLCYVINPTTLEITSTYNEFITIPLKILQACHKAKSYFKNQFDTLPTFEHIVCKNHLHFCYLTPHPNLSQFYLSKTMENGNFVKMVHLEAFTT